MPLSLFISIKFLLKKKLNKSFLLLNLQKDDSEEDEYALSENWTFEQKNRRWSRVGEMMAADIPTNLFDKGDNSSGSRNSSTEKLPTNTESFGYATMPMGMSFQSDSDTLPVRFRRTGSERLKDGAKAFLRRVESIKSRRRKRQNRDGVIISGPQELDLTHISSNQSDDGGGGIGKSITIARSTPPSPMPTSPFAFNTKLPTMANNNDLKVSSSEFSKFNQHRLSPLHYSNTPHKPHHQTSQSNRTSPLHFFSHNPNIIIDVKSGDDTSSYYSDASQESSCGGGGGGGGIGVSIPKKRPSRTRRFLQKGSKVEDIGAMSDSECHHMITRNQKLFKETNSNTNNPDLLEPNSNKLTRGGSLNLGKDSQRHRDGFKTRSFRSRSSCRKKDEIFGSEEEKIKAR